MTTRQLPSFGDLLREYRQRADLTQDELAERANLSTQAISALERGINRRPRKDTVQLLAEALNLTVAERIVFAAAARPARPFAARAEAPVDPGPPPPMPARTPGAVERQVSVRRIPRPSLAPTPRSVASRPPPLAGRLTRLRGRAGLLIVLLGMLGLAGFWTVQQMKPAPRDTTLYLATELQLSALDTAGDGRLYTDAGHVFTGTFRVRNTGSEPTSFLGLAIGVRRPTNCAEPWNAPALDFPPREGHFTLAPGEDLDYSGRWSLPEPGVYFAEPLQVLIGNHWTGFSPSVRVWFSIRDPRMGRLPERGCLTPLPAPSLTAPSPNP